MTTETNTNNNTVIVTKDIPYDDTYFAMSDVTPHFNKNQELVIYSGKGTRRHWGSPQVTSTVLLNQDGFISIHVGFSHKHGGGQGFHHFVNGQKRTWAQLTEAQQTAVYKAVKKNKQDWWKSPGVLKSKRVAPATVEAYKIVRVVDGEMVSVYDPDTKYVIGKKNIQACREDHNGGYYAFINSNDMIASFQKGNVFPSSVALKGTFAIIKVVCGGKRVDYQSGKSAFTHITPVEFVTAVTIE
jgi:hypothetical protein